jgi:hypothetical protein
MSVLLEHKHVLLRYKICRKKNIVWEFIFIFGNPWMTVLFPAIPELKRIRSRIQMYIISESVLSYLSWSLKEISDQSWRSLLPLTIPLAITSCDMLISACLEFQPRCYCNYYIGSIVFLVVNVKYLKSVFALNINMVNNIENSFSKETQKRYNEMTFFNLMTILGFSKDLGRERIL